MILEFTKPIPNLNSMYRTNRRHNVYKSTKAKEFTQFFASTYQQDVLLTGNLRLDIAFYIKRDTDIDAKLKCLLDAMNNVIYKDDIQITELNLKKFVVKDKQDIKTTVSIEQLI